MGGNRRWLHRWRRVVALAAIVMAPIAAQAGTPIFKCRSPNGDTTYTDIACNGGQQVEVDAGDADPRAIERLAREAQAASERYARERAAAAFDASLRGSAQSRPYAPMPQPERATYCEYCGGWVPYVPPQPQRRPPRKAAKSAATFVPAR